MTHALRLRVAASTQVDNVPGTAVSAALVARAREGDRAAFDALGRTLLEVGHPLALAITLDADEADDVVQRALIRAWERLGDVRDAERLMGWFLAIVRSVALDSRRAARRRGRVPLTDAEVAPAAFPGDHARRILDAMAVLPRVQREVLVLSDLHGWPHQRIAEVLGVTVFQSRHALVSARRVLRERLEIP